MSVKVVVLTLLVTVPLIVLLVRKWRMGSILLPGYGILSAAALLPIAYAVSTLFAANRATAVLGFNFNTDSLIVIALGFFALLSVVLSSINKSDTKSRVDTYTILVYALYAILAIFSLQIALQAMSVSLPDLIAGFKPVTSWVSISGILGLLIIIFVSNKIRNIEYKPSKLDIAIISISTLVLVVFLNITSVLFTIAIVMAVLISGLIYKKSNGINKSLVLLPAIVLVMTSFFVVDGLFLNAKVSMTLQGLTKVSFIDVRPNWAGTLGVAKGTVGAADTTAKLFGPGAGSFNKQWMLYKPSGVSNTRYWNTSFNYGIGFIPTSVITGGAIVLIAWIVFLLTLFKSLIYNRKSRLAGATAFIWLFMLFNPVDILLLVITFVVTGLFMLETIKSRTTTITKYKLRGDGTNKVVMYMVIPVIIVASIGVLATVGHRALMSAYLVSASNSMIIGNYNDAELTLNRAKSIADVAVVEQGYTRIALTRLNETLKAAEVEGVEVDKEAIQSALSNVLAHARRAIEKDPSDPLNYIALGNISEQLIGLGVEGSDESAIASYQQAAIIDPLNPSIPFALARVYMASKDFDKATKQLERAIGIKGNYVPALYQYGVIKLLEEDTEAALKTFSLVVQIDNSHANALYYVSAILAESGNLKEAIVAMERVRALNPENESVVKLIEGMQAKLADSSKE